MYEEKKLDIDSIFERKYLTSYEGNIFILNSSDITPSFSEVNYLFKTNPIISIITCSNIFLLLI